MIFSANLVFFFLVIAYGYWALIDGGSMPSVKISFSCVNDIELIQMQINSTEYHASYQQRIRSNNNKAILLEDPLQSLLIENTLTI